MGIYSGKTPQPEDQAPLLGCAFNVGNFWLRFVGIFHTMHQRAEKLRIIIPTHESTCAAVRALLCFLLFKHHPYICSWGSPAVKTVQETLLTLLSYQSSEKQ